MLIYSAALLPYRDGGWKGEYRVDLNLRKPASPAGHTRLGAGAERAVLFLFYAERPGPILGGRKNWVKGLDC